MVTGDGPEGALGKPGAASHCMEGRTVPRPQALSPPPSLPAWPTHGTEDTAAGDHYLELCWNREDLLLLGGQRGPRWGSVGL